jgi:hypothetical protein
MQQSASRALVPTVIGDLLRTVPVWQLLAVVPLAEGALHGLVVSLEGALHGHASEKMERPDRVCYGFLWFSTFSNGFPMVFTIFLWFSYGFLWFSPFSNGFPIVFTIFL